MSLFMLFFAWALVLVNAKNCEALSGQGDKHTPIFPMNTPLSLQKDFFSGLLCPLNWK